MRFYVWAERPNVIREAHTLFRERPAKLPDALFRRFLFLRREGLGFRWWLLRRRGGSRRLGPARRRAAGAWRAAGLGGPRVQKLDRLRERHLIGRDVRRQRGIDAGVAHIGTVAAVLGHDRPALLRMIA